MTRRSLIAAPLLVPARVLGRGGVAPSNKVGLAMLGVGWMGLGNLQDFLEDERVRIVALCDVDQRHLAEGLDLVRRKYGPPGCLTSGDFREILARSDVDAVCISLPDHWHAAAGIAAARAGKDIYGEKPVAHSLAEARALARAVSQHTRVFQTGSWQRSVDLFRRAVELVRNGAIGRVHRVEVGLPFGHTDFEGNAAADQPSPVPAHLNYEAWLGPAPFAPYAPARVHKNWRFHLDYGGGLLMDWIGHHLDIAHWALDLDHTGPIRVEAQGTFPTTNAIWNAPARFHVHARYRGGLEILIDGGIRGFPQGTKWIGDDGWLFVDRKAFDGHPPFLLTAVAPARPWRGPRSSGHRREFIDCVLSRRTPIAPCEAGLRSATPGWLGLVSIELGRPLDWDPDRETVPGDPRAARLLEAPLGALWSL